MRHADWCAEGANARRVGRTSNEGYRRGKGDGWRGWVTSFPPPLTGSSNFLVSSPVRPESSGYRMGSAYRVEKGTWGGGRGERRERKRTGGRGKGGMLYPLPWTNHQFVFVTWREHIKTTPVSVCIPLCLHTTLGRHISHICNIYLYITSNECGFYYRLE